MPTELPHMCNIQVVCGNHSLRATKPMRDESVKVLVAQSCPTLCNPMGCSLKVSSLSMEFSRQDYCSGLHSLLQGFFLTQGSSPGLLHCRQILHHLSHQGSSMRDDSPLENHFFFPSWALRHAGLVPLRGLTQPLAVEGQSPNHKASRKSPFYLFHGFHCSLLEGLWNPA